MAEASIHVHIQLSPGRVGYGILAAKGRGGVGLVGEGGLGFPHQPLGPTALRHHRRQQKKSIQIPEGPHPKLDP